MLSSRTKSSSRRKSLIYNTAGIVFRVCLMAGERLHLCLMLLPRTWAPRTRTKTGIHESEIRVASQHQTFSWLDNLIVLSESVTDATKTGPGGDSRTRTFLEDNNTERAYAKSQNSSRNPISIRTFIFNHHLIIIISSSSSSSVMHRHLPHPQEPTLIVSYLHPTLPLPCPHHVTKAAAMLWRHRVAMRPPQPPTRRPFIRSLRGPRRYPLVSDRRHTKS